VSADAHGCPGCPHPGIGPAIAGSADVLVNSRPALRVDDPGIHMACCGPNTWTAQKGAPHVFINGKAAYRMNDMSKHCGGTGTLIEGSSDVIVGDGGGGGGGGGAGGGGGGGSGGGSGGSQSGGSSAAAAQSSSSDDKKDEKKEPEKKLILAAWSTGQAKPEDKVKMSIATEGHPKGTSISIAVKTADGDESVDSITGSSTGDSTDIEWQYDHAKHGGKDAGTPSERLPDYYFEATVAGETKKSGILLIRTDLKITVKDKNGRPVRYARFQAKLVGGRTVEGELDKAGEYQISDVPPGSAHITFPDHKGIDFDS